MDDSLCKIDINIAIFSEFLIMFIELFTCAFFRKMKREIFIWFLTFLNLLFSCWQFSTTKPKRCWVTKAITETWSIKCSQELWSNWANWGHWYSGNHITINLYPFYIVPDKFLSIQVFVWIGLVFTRYLPIRTNIWSFIRTKTCTAYKVYKLQTCG